jgi:hypothetical protein
MGDQIKQKLGALIAASPYIEGPPLAARSKLRREVQAMLDGLELDEERLIVDAQSAGFEIVRRPDCRPEIVLSLALVEESR